MTPDLSEPATGSVYPGSGEPVPAEPPAGSERPAATLPEPLAPSEERAPNVVQAPFDETAFLIALHESLGVITTAAKAIGLENHKQIEAWARQNPAFATRYHDHLNIAIRTRQDRLISKAYDLALNGARKTRYNGLGHLLHTEITDQPNILSWVLEREVQRYHLDKKDTTPATINIKFAMNDSEEIEAADADWTEVNALQDENAT